MSVGTFSQAQLRQRLNLLLLLGLSLALSVGLLAVRVLLTGQVAFGFLLWDLLLAFIPFGLSTMLGLAAGRLRARVLLPVAAAWLLLFPAAPYLLTDLFHLQTRPGIAYWYDAALLLSCVWNGLVLAYFALLDMQQLVARRFGVLAGWGLAALALLLSSFGLYLGRVLRFSTWDALTNPFTLFYDILTRLLNPVASPASWTITLLYGLFLLLGYATLRLLTGAGAPARD